MVFSESSFHDIRSVSSTDISESSEITTSAAPSEVLADWVIPVVVVIGLLVVLLMILLFYMVFCSVTSSISCFSLDFQRVCLNNWRLYRVISLNELTGKLSDFCPSRKV
jgi:hypothetical protein